jgi:hypothetical protein
MTEQEWRTCAETRPMLQLVCEKHGRLSWRKWELHLLACLRSRWSREQDESFAQIIAAAEESADGRSSSSVDDLMSLWMAASPDIFSPEAERLRSIVRSGIWPDDRADPHFEQSVRELAEAEATLRHLEARARMAGDMMTTFTEMQRPMAPTWMGWEDRADEEAALGRHAAEARAGGAESPRLFREIFGNPFRPVAVESRWQTPKVTDVARRIYLDRAFEVLPKLADLLEEVGCTDPDILGHCRGSGPHVRGCWVLDLSLGMR